MSKFGIRVGNFLARYGITTEKSSIRLATEAGKNLVDDVAARGGRINKTVIEQSFAKSLPKRLRPEILTKREEMIPYYVNTGYSEQQARQILKGNFFALCVPNGTKKSPIYIPIVESNHGDLEAYTAHELEHALEKNNRISNKIRRKTSRAYFRIMSFFNKNFMQKLVKLTIFTDGIQNDLMAASKLGEIVHDGDVIYCPPIKGKLYKLAGIDKPEFISELEKILKKYVDCDSHGNLNTIIFNVLQSIFKSEISAYTVGGKVHEYAINMKNRTSSQTARVYTYKDMLEVINKAKKTYLKKLFTNKLAPSNRYQTKSDLLMLAKGYKQKIFLSKIVKHLNEDQREWTYLYMKTSPKYLENFMRAVKDENIQSLRSLKDECGNPIYSFSGEALFQAPPEKIAEFAKIAEEKTADGLYKYQYAARGINHPRFDLIKKIADVEINGTHPYHNVSGIMYLLSGEKVELAYKRILKAKEFNFEISGRLGNEIIEESRKMSHEEVIKRLFGI